MNHAFAVFMMRAQRAGLVRGRLWWPWPRLAIVAAIVSLTLLVQTFLSAQTTVPHRRDDLVISFADAGLWTVIDGTFRQLHTVAPDLIAAGDLDGDGIDDLAVDFAYAQWFFRNNLYWEGRGSNYWITAAIADLDEDGIGELIQTYRDSFGRDYGWIAVSWDNTSYVSFSPNGSFDANGRDVIAIGQLDGKRGLELVLGSTPGGILAFMNYTPTSIQIHPQAAQSLVTGDFDGNGLDDVAIGFTGGLGTWIYRYGRSWIPVHSVSALRMAAADLDGHGTPALVIDFGPGYGIWIYKNLTSWQLLHPSTAKQIVVADLDHNGIDDIVVDFGPDAGIWVFQNNQSWYQLTALSAVQIVAAHLK